MTEAQSSPTSEVAAPSRERLFFLVSLALAALVAVYFYYKSQSAASTTSERNLKLEEENANIKEQLQELLVARISLEEHQQVARSKLHEVQAEYDSVAATLDSLQRRIDNWQESADGALDSELGKRIAAEPELLATFEAILARQRPSVDIARQLRTRLEELRAPLESAKQLKEGAYAPTELLVLRLAELKKQAEEAATVYSEHQGLLDTVLAKAPSIPSQTTLRAALVERKRQQDEEQARIITAELEKARKEITEQKAKDQADRERIIAKAEAERLDEETALKAAAIDKETKKLADGRKTLDDQAKAQQARAQLERDFERDLGQIRSLLRPMLVEAKTQPGEYRKLERTTVTGPISLSRLRGSGALDNTTDGVKTLFMMFAVSGHDREQGGFPRYQPGDMSSELDKAQTAQELLIKYGDLMVEKKMLAE